MPSCHLGLDSGMVRLLEQVESPAWCESQLCSFLNHVTLGVSGHPTKPQFVSEDPSS